MCWKGKSSSREREKERVEKEEYKGVMNSREQYFYRQNNEAPNQWTDNESRQEGIDIRGKSEEEPKGLLFFLSNKRAESILRLFMESI